MNIEFLLRLLFAGTMGMLIGIEREYRAKEAGHRTHFLVALGSALLMIISQYGFADITASGKVSFDPSRIASQVVTGIGFLGAGTIIFQRQIVRGLTTAAGIWATSAIGLTIGAGLYLLGFASTILVLLGLETINLFSYEGIGRNLRLVAEVSGIEPLNNLLDVLHQRNYTVHSCQIKEVDDKQDLLQVTITISGRLKRRKRLIPQILGIEGIRSINVD